MEPSSEALEQGVEGYSAIVGGTVSIEAGCIFVLDGGGSRSVVFWPWDTTWQAETNSVLLGTGLTVRDGDTISGGGGETSDVGGLARRCSDLADGSVALFNNFDSQITVESRDG